MSIMLSRYLKDFGEPSPSAPIIDVDDFAAETASAFADLPQEPKIDVDAERREAYSEGVAAATVELTEKYEGEAQVAAEAHVRELEELKLRYEIEAAAVIASRIRDMAEEIATLVSEVTAAAITPIMTEALAKSDRKSCRPAAGGDPRRRGGADRRARSGQAFRYPQGRTWRACRIGPPS